MRNLEETAMTNRVVKCRQLKMAECEEEIVQTKTLNLLLGFAAVGLTRFCFAASETPTPTHNSSDATGAAMWALGLCAVAGILGFLFYKRAHKFLSQDVSTLTEDVQTLTKGEARKESTIRTDEGQGLSTAISAYDEEQGQIRHSLKEQAVQAEIRAKALDKYVNQLVSSNAETVGLLNDLEWKNAKLEELNNRLEQLAFTDGLTGLSNHRTFQEKFRIAFAAAKRYNQPLSLMILDVDHFKKLNDNMGHPAGDAVLVDLAKTLQTMVRETDLAARYGGEEFAVILPNTGLEGAIELGERIRESFEKSHTGPAPYTVSIGVAVMTPATEKANDLLQIADSSLYQAKKTGRNRVSATQKNQTERRGA